MAAQDNAKLVQTIVDAYNSKDVDRFAAVTTQNCEVQDIPSGIVTHGPAGYQQFIEDLHTAFPGGKIEVTNLHATDDQVVLEFIGRGVHAGPIKTATRAVPPTGKSFEVRFCAIYEINNGRIASVRTYYDRSTFSQHLGVHLN